MRKNSLILGISIAFCTSNALADINPQKIYHLPQDAKCQNNYCTDNENRPITGIMRKYQDGIIIREYHTLNGYLDGVNKAYYDDGKIKAKREYTKGVLNGKVTEYNKDGKITEQTTYVSGKKEGESTIINSNYIFKATYHDDTLSGDAAIWDVSTYAPIYKLKIENEQIVEGSYFYENKLMSNNRSEIALDNIVIEGINKKCLEFNTNYSSLSCSFNHEEATKTITGKQGISDECDSTWYQENKTAIAQYIKNCKCTDISNNILLLSKEHSTENNQELIELKEKYQQHCTKKN